ncbi:MAG: efflux RND transporter permease subunit [Alphaproteobacteria bacterium]
MGLIQACTRNPAGVAVVVVIAMLLGLMSIRKLPVQLFPDIERPTLGVSTFWRAASPEEMESEILEEQENVLQGLPGLIEMSAEAGPGFAFVNLQFGLETDMNAVTLEVLNRLNRLPPLPEDADPPRLQFGGNFGGSSEETLIFFFLQRLPDNPRSLESYGPFINDVLVPRLEAIDGVSGVEVNNSNAGNEQVQIIFDPFLAAQYGIDIPAIAAVAGRADNSSGGQIPVGRRQYALQFEGRFDPASLGDQVIEWREGQPVRLRDIARIEVSIPRRVTFSYQNGNEAFGLRITKENGANALAAIEAVKAEFEEMRGTVLKENGLDAQQSFDPSVFIKRAIGLLTNNLMIGIGLAVGVLWLFLRRPRATLIIGSTIPICLLTTFLVLDLAGRSINVISLAGLAFATGMVLDAAIVVLENIIRHRERGADVAMASERGAMEVFGALFASTATTVAIFVPIMFIKDVEGQLFADLALTIAIAVTMSMIVAITVLPTAARLFVRQRTTAGERNPFWDRVAGVLMALTDTPARRMGWIAGLIVLPLTATWMLTPSIDYLPPVKRDAVDVFFDLPDGVTIDFVDDEIAKPVIERLTPFLDGAREPALLNYYFIAFPRGGTMGVRVADQSRVNELATIMRNDILAGLPDTQAFDQQGNLFGGFGGGSGGLEINIQGTDVVGLARVAEEARRLLNETLPPGANVRIFPNPEPAQPELRVRPKDDRILEAELTRPQVATMVRALGEGLFVGDYFDGERQLDIILRSEPWDDPDRLAGAPIATPSGAIVPFSELVDIERTVGPGVIRRVDRRRTFALGVGQPPGMTLQQLIDAFETQVKPRLEDMLPPGASIRYGGNADSLQKAIATMAENFGLAIVLLVLLMAALFRSLRDAVLVAIALPLATVGGMGALQVLNLFTVQPLDLLTMIGFIILLGLVVNNAILLVDRTRRAEGEGTPRRLAVRDSLVVRLRPIFMSTLTSIFGMLPLVLIPGEGSAIYRGLAASIAGGMSVSLVFTLILLPSLLRLGENRAVHGGGAAGPSCFAGAAA